MSSMVLITDTAIEDLRQIADYISGQSGEKSIAIQFVSELRDKIKILETFPESGAFPRDRIMRSAEYRFLVYKDCLIFYRYDKAGNTVYIMAIFSSKRDYMRVMRKFL